MIREEFWIKVFLQVLEPSEIRKFEDAEANCAALCADEALAQFDKRFNPKQWQDKQNKTSTASPSEEKSLSD